MDDPLRVADYADVYEDVTEVLILIVMDDPLRDEDGTVSKVSTLCLNPYCNG